MAMVIKSADDILLIPLLKMILQTDRYTKGRPQIRTQTHASFSPSGYPVLGRIKEASKNNPPMIVMGHPAKKSLILLIISILLDENN